MHITEKAIILAGGSGKRFWPRSTEEKPKQFLQLMSDKSLIQETFYRARRLVTAPNVYVVANANHSKHIYDQLTKLPKENIIFEPAAKNTAAAIALGISKMNDDDVVIVMPSDHFIRDEKNLQPFIHLAFKSAAEKDVIVTLGIYPSKPETGYGYMEVDKELLETWNFPFKVKRFHEKPNLETATFYVESGNFVWNSGIFFFKVSTMWNAFKKYMPDLYKAFKETDWDIKKIYNSLEPISIDYGVMEKADNVVVIPLNVEWNDVGSWDAVYDLMPKDKNGNFKESEDVIFRNAQNCAVFDKDHHVVVSHLEDVIVVIEGKNVLVTKRGTTQDVKNL
ncbi:mannose-1-phosphate guanylyltransferase [Athalassotoga sp.]|uniref:mannose-1-phosphate guanylyltransferase n=1 Tax=Athalassotoga sp. TaxID=2022597 RepID=UPI003D047333